MMHTDTVMCMASVKGSVSPAQNGRWRTQVIDNAGRRQSADVVLGRKGRTYASAEEARLVAEEAVAHLKGRQKIVTIQLSDLDQIRGELIRLQEQVVEAQATIVGLQDRLAALGPR